MENVEPSPWIPGQDRINCFIIKCFFGFVFSLKLRRKDVHLGQNLVGDNVLKTVLPRSI